MQFEMNAAQSQQTQAVSQAEDSMNASMDNSGNNLNTTSGADTSQGKIGASSG